MQERLLSKIDIDVDNTFVPDGNAPDLKFAAQEYEQLIIESVGIDLQVLGIGEKLLGREYYDFVFANEPEWDQYRSYEIYNFVDCTIKNFNSFLSNFSDILKFMCLRYFPLPASL